MALATRQIQVNRDLTNARTAYYRDHLISTAEERSNFDQAALQMKGYLDGLDRVVTLAASDRAEALKLANGEQRQRAEGYQEQLTRLREFNSEGARQAGAAATGRGLAENVRKPEVLQARWKSFAALGASIATVLHFLNRLVRR